MDPADLIPRLRGRWHAELRGERDNLIQRIDFYAVQREIEDTTWLDDYLANARVELALRNAEIARRILVGATR